MCFPYPRKRSVWNGAYKSSLRPLHLVPCLHGWPVGLAVTDGLTRSGLVVQMEFTLAVTKSLYDPVIAQWPGWDGSVSFLVSSCLHHRTRMQVLLIVSLAAGLSNRAKEVTPRGTRCSVFSVLLLTEPIAPGHPINQAERGNHSSRWPVLNGAYLSCQVFSSLDGLCDQILIHAGFSTTFSPLRENSESSIRKIKSLEEGGVTFSSEQSV